ncbi:MAG TPA: hypothetical protein VK747_09720 [Blastocatellia bacterium]|nr:hypothetical protein [Blastocatellia bacterium]
MKGAATALLAMAFWMAMDLVSFQADCQRERHVLTPHGPSWEGLAIVVNKTNPTENLAFRQLRQAFSQEKMWWSSKRRIKLVALPRGTAERQTVLQVIYRMKDSDLDRYFFLLHYEGKFPAQPTTLASPEEVKRLVSNSPGALAYLRASDVDDSVKVLRINGLLPGDDGYPLRVEIRTPK